MVTTAPQAGPDKPQVAALLAICIGFFMVSLDATVVNVALPNLEHGFRIGVSGLQWVVDAYTLTFAALLLSAGALGDRRGPKAIFQLGLTVFFLASALCGLAPSASLVILGRIAQGIGAALLVSTSLALLQAVYTDPKDRARAFGVWGGVGGVAVATGPVLGGLLVDLFDWRAVFFINLPLGIAGLLLARNYIPEPAGRAHKLDLPAQLLSFVALGSLTAGLIEAGPRGWTDRLVILALVLAVISGVLFVMVESRTRVPMLPLSLFTSSRFSAANSIGFLINFAFYGQLFVATLYFQQVRDYSALRTGMALLPQAITSALAAFASGRLAAEKGPRFPMMVGLSCGAITLFCWVFVGAHASYLLLVVPLVGAGFGVAMTAPAATGVVMSAVPSQQGGVASGLINASRQTGSVLGVAVLGALVSSTHRFVDGLHLAVALAALAFGISLLLTVGFLRPPQQIEVPELLAGKAS
ncbi:MAG: MFS transporter [Actinomycetota bacterium]|nr:MFS transporter [Actinomycetota bacterium]MDQ2958152.1 MFS transporter [Actinomycetota bacterium]